MADPTKLAVSAHGLGKTFGKGANAVHALRGVDLEVPYGELVMLVGPSGCGKTTLISILAGILDRDRGEASDCSVLGVDPQHMRGSSRTRWRGQNVGFVFQQFHLIPHLDATGNVETALLYRGLSKAERRRRAIESLDKVGLGHRHEHRPVQMSGGEQQRVALARALVTEPKILLADEPTGALDSQNAENVMELLTNLQSPERAVVLVTHAAEVADAAFRKVSMRDGRIVSDMTRVR